MNNSLPLSQLVISAVIPAGESHAVIDIDKKSFPDDIDLTINSVVVKIDTTSLYNVKTTNTVVARNDSGPKNIVVEAGYYDQESLEEMFGSYLTFTEDGYVHPSGPAYDLVFQQAPDLSRILGFDEIQASDVKGREPMDVSNRPHAGEMGQGAVRQYLRRDYDSKGNRKLYGGLHTSTGAKGTVFTPRPSDAAVERTSNVPDRSAARYRQPLCCCGSGTQPDFPRYGSGDRSRRAGGLLTGKVQGGRYAGLL